MNKEFLNKALQLFDTNEKWDSFLELSYNKENLKDLYFTKLFNSLNKKFKEKDIVQDWGYLSYNNGKDYRWFLSDFGENSIYIRYGERLNLYLWFHREKINVSHMRQLLNSEKYSALYCLLDRIDSFGNENEWMIIKESGNFSFGSPYDGNFTEDQLAWYAGKETEEFVNQIAKKVNRIRKNPELTQLLRELNEQCKK